MNSALLPPGSDAATFVAQTEEESHMMQAKTFDIPTVSVMSELFIKECSSQVSNRDLLY